MPLIDLTLGEGFCAVALVRADAVPWRYHPAVGRAKGGGGGGFLHKSSELLKWIAANKGLARRR